MFDEEDMLSSLTEAGYNRPLNQLSLADKKVIISSLVDFHLFMKVKAVMDQFNEGLALGGVLSLMKDYCDLLRPMFVDETPALTVGMHVHFFYKHYCIAIVVLYAFWLLYMCIEEVANPQVL